MRRQQAHLRQSATTGRTDRRAWRKAQDAGRIGFLALTLFSMTALSGLHVVPSLGAPALTQPDHTPKSLAERMAALEAAVSALQTTVAAQSTQIAALQETVTQQATQIAGQATKITTLESTATAHSAKLAPVSVSGTVFTLSGVNVRIVDGSGSTQSTSGLGNLAIGYNKERVYAGAFNIRTGSHNLILGDENNYTSYGGLVAGDGNSIFGPYASVSGGTGNRASGNFASVSGGLFNTASGNFASVSGGLLNTASGLRSWVGGGYENTASGNQSAVSGEH